MNSDLEFLRNIFILESIGFVIVSPFWIFNIFFEYDSLLHKFTVVFASCKSIFGDIFDILLKVSSIVFSELSAIDHFSSCFLCLFIMNLCKLMHLFKVFLQDFTLKRSNISQESSWISCPDLSFFYLDIVVDHCSCSYEAS